MSINSIIQNVSSFIMNKMSIPLIPVPAIMLICSTIKRPGLSPMLIASRIITRQQDFGAPVGVNIDGSPNLMNQMFYVIADEIVNALKMEGKVEIAKNMLEKNIDIETISELTQLSIEEIKKI